MKRMRIRKRRKSSNRLKNQLPKQRQEANPRCQRHHQRLSKGKTEAKGQSQRKCQGQKGEETKGEERKEEQKGRHPCTFQKACCQRWYQRSSLQAPVWGARSERRGWEGWGRRRKRRRSERTGWMCGSWWSQWKAFQRFWWQVQQAAQSRKSSSTDQGDLEKFWNQGRKNHVGGLLVARRTPRQAAGKCADNPSFRSWL